LEITENFKILNKDLNISLNNLKINQIIQIFILHFPHRCNVLTWHKVRLFNKHT
jgi:hypothetical protein